MPDLISPLKIFPYDGQQDSTRNPLLISPKDIIESNNIVYSTYSTKKLRPGIQQAFTQPPFRGNHVLQQVDFWRQGQQRVVSWDGTRLIATNPANGVAEDITGPEPLPTDVVVTFVVFVGLLLIFFSGGATNIKIWTMAGPITDLNPSLPKAPFGRIWLNSLWIPDPTVQGRLLSSVPGDPADFTSSGAGVYDLDVGDGAPEGITAIFPPFFKSLYVAKRLSIYQGVINVLVDGSFIVVFTKISDGVGCISHNGVIAAESQIYFPSDWGWHTFESTNKISGIDTELLSTEIQPVWVNDTNFNRSQYITGTYNRDLNSLMIIFPAASYNFPTDLWGYSLVAKKWYRWSNFNHTSICPYVEASTRRLRTLVGSSTGDVGFFNLDITTDYGDRKYGCSFISGIIAPSGVPGDNFAFNYISPIFVPQIGGTFTITYKIDGKTIERKEFNMRDDTLGALLGETFVTGESVLGGVPTAKIKTTRIKGYGMFYQMIIEYEPTISQADEIGFEMLGVLVQVSRVSDEVDDKGA